MASQTFTDQRSDSAQQQLAVLREALESRLATLEEVLADPSRGESLAGLILDLSRIATEEAQAAASQACLATRAEADKEITELRASAKAALEAAQAALRSAHASLEQERAVGVDLRRAADQAHLEIQKQTELLAAREQLQASLTSTRQQLEAEVARYKTIVADLQRTAVDKQQQLETELAHEREASEGRERAHAELRLTLDAERAAGADARGAVQRAETRVAMLEREQEAARAAHEVVIADLDRERAAGADARGAVQRAETRVAMLEREQEAARAAHEAVIADSDREHASAAELRRAAERATALEVTLGRETSEGRAAHEELSSELAQQREAAALLQEALAESQQALAAACADLEVERTSSADLRQAVEYADQQLASARSNETQALADHKQLMVQLDRLRAEVAVMATAAEMERELPTEEVEPALPPLAAHPPPATPPSPAPPAEQATDYEDDDWKAMRLASRYVFAEEITIQINGDPGRLFDLSTSGCQLLSHTALKPNQTVKVTLPNKKKPIKCTGTVVWARLEPPAAGQTLRYRVGVRFTKADEPAIETFATHHGSTA